MGSASFSSHGKPILATNNETKITMAAKKMAKSRAGKAWPSGNNRGKVSTPAKVIVPRAPASDKTQVMRRLTAANSLRLSKPSARVILTDENTQTKRNKIKTAQMAKG